MGMIKTLDEILIMKDVCKRTSVILNHLILATKVGTTGLDINSLAKKYFEAFSVESAFLNLYSFPAQLCISVNEYIIHGIPNAVPFKDGDVVKLDIGAKYKGFFSDMARTFIIGKRLKPSHEMLIDANKKALDLAIDVIKDGVETNEISKVIENYAKETEFGSVDSHGGHGIGQNLHEPPKIFNAIRPGQPNVILREGMTICIEPQFTLGSGELTYQDGNKWMIKTKDGSVGAHFEDVILVLKDGAEVLTR